MKVCTAVLAICLFFIIQLPSEAVVLNINYTLTDSTITDGAAAGTIRDGTNQIGTWGITNFTFTRRNSSASYVPSIGIIATNTADNSYLVAGVGIKIMGDGSAANGVTSFGYTLNYSLTTAALSAGYLVDSVAFWGKYPNSVVNYGPAPPSGDGGNFTLSGFSGSARVSDPNNNLLAADGYTFSSGTVLPGWRPGDAGTEQDWTASSVKWSLIAPDSTSLTYFADYRNQTYSAANESTAFNINIVPEPSVSSMLVAGTIWTLARRKIFRVARPGSGLPHLRMGKIGG